MIRSSSNRRLSISKKKNKKNKNKFERSFFKKMKTIGLNYLPWGRVRYRKRASISANRWANWHLNLNDLRRQFDDWIPIRIPANPTAYTSSYYRTFVFFAFIRLKSNSNPEIDTKTKQKEKNFKIKWNNIKPVPFCSPFSNERATLWSCNQQ